MALESIVNINIDFYDKKYILINAKQLDKKTRRVLVTCYNQGELFNVDYREHAAYVRYRKADDYGVFNSCEVTKDGKVLVELTEQMLASDGICCADLVLINRGQAEVNPDTGEIIVIDRASILSTMNFYIDVSETAFANSEIESSYEYDGLNDLLERAEAEYSEVIRAAKSYAIGDAGGFRENENTDNAKYYYQQSRDSAEESSASATAAKASEANAVKSAEGAANSETLANIYKTNANTYMNTAENYMNSAMESKDSAGDSASEAKEYANSAQNSMNSASVSASNASESATNAYNYYMQTEAITNGLNGAFLPMGTIAFAELATLKENGTVGTGYLYNISDNFVTDESFKEGAGIEYTAGTNVYYTADGYWCCLAGMSVTGVKGDAETVYRKGNINITVENIGAVASSDIATVDEMKNYLGI